MKFTAQRSDLESALSRASTFVARTASLPVLQTFLVIVESGEVQFVGTSIDGTCRARMRAQVSTEGRVCIPAARTLELIKRMDAGSVSLELKRKEVVVRAGAVTSKVPVMDAKEFPLSPDAAGAGFDVEADVFEAVATLVVPFASRELSRPTLNAVRWASEGFTSTDGFRLVTLDMVTPVDGELLVMPDLITKAASMLHGTVRVTATDNMLHLDDGDTVLIGRLSEGPYPRYSQFFGLQESGVLTIALDDLTAALGRAELFVNPVTNSITIACLKDEQSHELAATSENGSHEEPLEGEYTGEDFWITWSVRYLSALLGALRKRKAETVNVRFGPDNTRQTLFDSPELPGLTMLLMPLRSDLEKEPRAIRERKSVAV